MVLGCNPFKCWAATPNSVCLSYPRCREEGKPCVPIWDSSGGQHGSCRSPAYRGETCFLVMGSFFSHVHPSDQTSPHYLQATEVKYVKRRKEIVIREYHKWRAYFKKRVRIALRMGMRMVIWGLELKILGHSVACTELCCATTCVLTLHQKQNRFKKLYCLTHSVRK